MGPRLTLSRDDFEQRQLDQFYKWCSCLAQLHQNVGELLSLLINDCDVWDYHFTWELGRSFPLTRIAMSS